MRELPDGDEWQYEPKWDGFRGLLENASGELRLWSRNARPLLRYFPELAPLGDLLPARSCLDGEIVIVRDGILDFDAMQTRLHPAESRVRKLSTEIPASFVAFDVPVWGGEEHWRAPLAERRKTLEKVASELAPLALHARPRRGARMALVVRGDRARRRDRQTARRAVPRGRADGGREGEAREDGRLRRRRRALEERRRPADRDAPARPLGRRRRPRLRRFRGGRSGAARRDRRRRAAAARGRARAPVLGAEPLGRRRARGSAGPAGARRRGALRQGAGPALPPRHEAHPASPRQGAGAVHLA